MTEMPKDWWPESVTVVARHGNIELGFVVNNDPSSGAYKDNVPANLDALRNAVWVEMHMPSREC